MAATPLMATGQLCLLPQNESLRLRSVAKFWVTGATDIEASNASMAADGTSYRQSNIVVSQLAAASGRQRTSSPAVVRRERLVRIKACSDRTQMQLHVKFAHLGCPCSGQRYT